MNNQIENITLPFKNGVDSRLENIPIDFYTTMPDTKMYDNNFSAYKEMLKSQTIMPEVPIESGLTFKEIIEEALNEIRNEIMVLDAICECLTNEKELI